jgi:hypothetical protein
MVVLCWMATRGLGCDSFHGGETWIAFGAWRIWAGHPRCMGRTIGRGGPTRGGRQRWDFCVLDCYEAWIAARGCVSFCGSGRIFASITEALIGEGMQRGPCRCRGRGERVCTRNKGDTNMWVICVVRKQNHALHHGLH